MYCPPPFSSLTKEFWGGFLGEASLVLMEGLPGLGDLWWLALECQQPLPLPLNYPPHQLSFCTRYWEFQAFADFLELLFILVGVW